MGQTFWGFVRSIGSSKGNGSVQWTVQSIGSIQSISMGAAGTDMFHHLDFLRQAEEYRRVFIKTLNDEYAFGGSKTGERGWKADTAFFQSVKDFVLSTTNDAECTVQITC